MAFYVRYDLTESELYNKRREYEPNAVNCEELVERTWLDVIDEDIQMNEYTDSQADVLTQVLVPATQVLTQEDSRFEFVDRCLNHLHPGAGKTRHYRSDSCDWDYTPVLNDDDIEDFTDDEDCFTMSKPGSK